MASVALHQEMMDRGRPAPHPHRAGTLLSAAVLAAVASLVPVPLPAGEPWDPPGGSAPPFAGLNLERGRLDTAKVALTFDGGSDAGHTREILQILEDRGVRATFFLTGGYITRFPNLVRAIAASGHEVGNHTWSHPHLTSWERTRRQDTLPTATREFLRRELGATSRAYREVTGLGMAPLWRAPYGEFNDELLSWGREAGYLHVSWTREPHGGATLDSLDWVADRGARNYLTSSQIRNRILGFGASRAGLSGGIVLMHLCTRSDDPGYTRLGEIIDALRARGYSLVTVSELLRELAPPDGAPLRTAALR